MAKIDFSGLEDVEKRFLRREKAAVKAVPEMVKAGGDVLVKAQQAEIVSMGLVKTGDLKDSIKKTRVYGNETEKYVLVYPHGVHHESKNSRYRNKKGGKRTVTNAEVGFVQQYGRSNMPANPYMTVANEKSADEVHRAMLEVWRKEQNGN